MAKQSGVGWNHPIDASDQWDGFNDSGIETFAGSPIKNLAREVNQNALDAAADGCVNVVIRLRRVATTTIPHLEELRANLEACRVAAQGEGPKAHVFFERALELLEEDTVNVLEVSDYNTHGMKGPPTNGTPYFAFMKAKGQSRKDSDTAAGSYGIGKFAPYAVSMIRTIFVSTVFEDEGGNRQQYTQGKSILMSYDDRAGNRRQGAGYWGLRSKCQPVIGFPEDLPDWLLRATNARESRACGTKLSILCFDDSDDWQDYLAVSVAENFFGAIAANGLTVDVDGVHILNRDTIASFLSDERMRRLIQDQSNEPEQFDNSRSYLEALQGEEEVLTEESQMRDLGNVQVKILVREGFPKKVCFLRNGMFITDDLDRLKSFSDFKEFVAVVRCLSDAGNVMLRDMEPPKHNDFEPERRATRKEQKIAARALKDLAQWIRDMLKRHAKDPVSEVTEIDELKEFFFEEGADGSGEGTQDINPHGKVLIQAKPIRMRIHPRIEPADPGETDGGEDGNGSGGSGPGGERGNGRVGGGNGPGRGKGSAGKGGSSQKPFVKLADVRTIMGKGNARRVSFTPKQTGTVQLRILEAGADSDYETTVVSVDQGEIRNGCIILQVAEDVRYVLNVQLSRNFAGAIKVVAHEL